ncbi:ubiquinone biosynthesis protein mitochondrial [Lasius niger]|uniref:Ubiquinone biosynthesis protein mitochondrial n=1 Tax=Lasius niger TaxID=67767 RepID=A0A0J7L4M0_LASNI|nr:ubiquinone biosynthesis protein mitochondrial [Lasius niger]
MSQTFVKRFTNFLKDHKPKEALELFTTESNEVIEDTVSEIVSVTASYLTESYSQSEQELFECCKIVLNIIAERCNPMETVLEFLEQIECLDDIKFCAILEPLGICMMKMQDKSKAIEWCINTIKSYIEDLASLRDVDSNRIVDVYKGIVSFMEPLVQEAVKIYSKFEEGSLLGDYLLSFLISLCEKPSYYWNRNIVEEATYKEFSEEIITLSFYLTGDILYFLNVVSKRRRNIIRNKVQEGHLYTENYKRSMLFESSNNISDLAYANFYFYIITKKDYWKNVPQIYSPYYILETCTYFFEILLCKEEDIVISNGLIFMETVIKRVSPRSVNSEVLGLQIYLDLFKSIIKVMIYCNSDTERKKALHIFHKYIEIFNMEARYSVILYLYEISDHSGLLSLIISILKSSIIDCLNSTPRNPQFLGKNLELILKKICNLPHGSSSDLVEISDEVITTLNLLRFLFIRDKHNETGIWNITDVLKNYLNPLREGIDLCRTHWKVKIKDLEQQKKDYNNIHDYNEMKKAHAEVTLTVGGEQLPVMPLPEKISFCYQAINGLDVMESILIRVNECIDAAKEFSLSFRRLWTSRALLADQSENDSNRKTEPQQSTHEESDEEYEKNIKTKILGASLKFVPDMGWSKQAISAGAESIGYPGVIHGLFPNGGADLVQYFYSMCNRELNQMLEKETLAIEADPSSPGKTPEQQVRDSVETRLRMVIPYKKTWAQAIAIMTLPPNVPTALANLLTLVDDICYYAGDRSVDINWYARRMILATIYKATELYMLQDTSEDHKETWLFLDRRIKDALQVHAMLSSAAKPSPDEALSRATETATAVFVT